MWKDLNRYWKQVYTLAWKAYQRKTIPIGAVIVDAQGEIIAQGRNVTYDKISVHPLAKTNMGHAEMVAMMQLKKFDHPNINDYSLYVGVEPSLMSFGAMLMMGIKNVYYAANDMLIDIYNDKHKQAFFNDGNIHFSKVKGDIEIFQIIMQTSRDQHKPNHRVSTNWERNFRSVIQLGAKLHKEQYFEIAMEKNANIQKIYNEIMTMYYNDNKIVF